MKKEIIKNDALSTGEAPNRSEKFGSRSVADTKLVGVTFRVR